MKYTVCRISKDVGMLKATAITYQADTRATQYVMWRKPQRYINCCQKYWASYTPSHRCLTRWLIDIVNYVDYYYATYMKIGFCNAGRAT